MRVKKFGKAHRCLMLIPRMGNGGAERVLATLANGLTQKGYNVIILTLTSSESFYQLEEDVKIIGAGFNVNRKNIFIKTFSMVINGVRSIYYINAYIRKWKPDIMLSFLTHTNILALIVRIFNPKVPLIISERAEPNKRNFLFRIITKYFYSNADYLVCQSKNVAKFFSKKTQCKIKIIPNPLDKKSIVLEKPQFRRKTVVGVGRLFPQKNFDLLIDSFNEIKEEFPDYTLEIYGEGFLKEHLQEKINRLGLNNRVFLMGVKKNVMRYVYDAELFVMSSDFEGFPNALIEAMASGLPVISTDFSTGIARELIKEDNGIIVPIRDKKALSNAMRRILSDKKLQQTMSNNNRKIINQLSSKEIINRWIDLFNNLKA